MSQVHLPNDVTISDRRTMLLSKPGLEGAISAQHIIVIRSFAAVVLLGLSVSAPADQLTCPHATTLDELATCIRQQMPQNSSNLYVTPSPAERADFQAVVTQMMNGSCNFILPASLADDYQVNSFTDLVSQKSYCVLMETLDANNDGFVDKGWGTFIVNNSATRPNLNQSAPHPIYDSTTENQAINIFQDTDSRSYLMCGAHRHANGTSGGSCESNYGQADCAHQADGMFFAAVQALNEYYGSTQWTHIQWHGNLSCPMDIYGSQGFNNPQPPESNIISLRDLMVVNQPDYTFEVTGTGAVCPLNGTDNVEGRYLNGATDICTSNSGGVPNNKFVHIEQSRPIRDGGAAVWDLSVQQNWPSTPAVPATQ